MRSKSWGKTLPKKKKVQQKNSTNSQTEECNSKVIKIYGTSVIPIVCYKSMLVDRHMTAHDVVCLALRRFGLPDASPNHFCLFDVVGETGSNEFKEQYARELAKHEFVYVIHSLWQPSALHRRRFELRRKVVEAIDWISSIEKQEQVKENIIMEEKLKEKPPVNLKRRESETWSLSRERGIDLDLDNCSHTLCKQCRTKLQSFQDTFKEETKKTIDIPKNSPYLITIQGYDRSRDSLMHVLSNDVIVLCGPRAKSAHVTSINLYSPDVLAMHCWLYRVDTRKRAMISRVIPRDYSCGSRKARVTYIDPISDGIVTVNGSIVTGKVALQSGDVICIGKYYQFIFKDSVEMEGQESKNEDSDVIDPTIMTSLPSPSHKITPPEWQRRRNEEYENDHRRFKLTLRPGVERDVIFEVVRHKTPGNSPLTASYVLMAALEHCAVKNDQLQTRQLILEMASSILKKAEDEAEALNKIVQSSRKQKDNVYSCLEKALPSVRACSYWLTNCMELHGHLSKHLSSYLMAPGVSLPADSPVSLATAEDEILGQLEDSAAVLFRQVHGTVDYCISCCVSSFLNSNPFHDEEVSPSGGEDTVDALLTVYQTTLNELRATYVHPQVVSRLFSTAFRSTSVHVFNAIINKDCTSRYYKWSRGVLLRGNLDTVDAWAAANHLGPQATVAMTKASSVINLLAMPKQHLLQTRWRCLRQQFPDLKPAQMHHVLSNYQLGPSIERPYHWIPSQTDARNAMQDVIQEKATAAPVFVIPESGYTFSLDKPCISTDFANFVKRISMQYGLQDGYDSGMSEDWSGTEDVSKSTIYENAVMGNSRKSSSESSELNRSRSPIAVEKSGEPQISQRSSDREKCATTVNNVKEMVGRQRRLSRQTYFQNGDSLVMQEVTNGPIAPKRRSRAERKTKKEERNKARSLSMDKRVRMDHPKISQSLSMSFTEGIPMATSSPERHPCFDSRSIPPQPTVPAPLLRSGRNRIRGRRALDEDFAARVTGNEEVERTSAGHLLFNGRLSGAVQPRNYKLSESTCSNELSDTSMSLQEDAEDDLSGETYEVTLQCGARGLGLGLIDGMFTPLKRKGIYVRTLVQNSPAAANGQLRVGDKLLSVNGQSVVGEDYQSAMDIIKKCSKDSIVFKACRSSKAIALQITRSAC